MMCITHSAKLFQVCRKCMSVLKLFYPSRARVYLVRCEERERDANGAYFFEETVTHKEPGKSYTFRILNAQTRRMKKSKRTNT